MELLTVRPSSVLLSGVSGVLCGSSPDEAVQLSMDRNVHISSENIFRVIIVVLNIGQKSEFPPTFCFKICSQRFKNRSKICQDVIFRWTEASFAGILVE